MKRVKLAQRESAHDKELYRKYLTTLPPGSPIAIESVGNWYWMIEAMEKAGHKPILGQS